MHIDNSPAPEVPVDQLLGERLPMCPEESRKLDHEWQREVAVVTGTIGSGKSTLVKVLAEMGAYCVSADELARRSVEKGSEGLEKIVAEFGSGLLSPDGTLDRKKLGEIVFRDPAKRAVLESITHPIIAALAEHEFTEAILDDRAPVMIYECPLFFEAGLEGQGFGKVIVITADRDVCLERIMRRDGLSREQAELRLAAQLPVEEKVRRADIVIDNSSTEEALREQVGKHFDALRAIRVG